MATMGDRIKERREELGISHDKLAELVVKKHDGKITGPGIAHLESRASKRSNASREIALALGVNHDWLLTGKGPRETLKSIDAKLQLLPQDDFDEVYDILDGIVEGVLERRNIRQ